MSRSSPWTERWTPRLSSFCVGSVGVECRSQMEPRVRQQMDLEIRRHYLVDLGQELLELGGLRQLLCPPLPGQ